MNHRKDIWRSSVERAGVLLWLAGVMFPRVSGLVIVWMMVAGDGLGASAPIRGAEAEGLAFFEKRVRPVLVERCYECHSERAGKAKGGLRLDTREGWSRGGDSGPAVVAGDPEASLLVRAVRWLDEDTQMPPKNRLSVSEVEALVAWVRMGAPDPRVAGTAESSKPTSVAPAAPAEAVRHWAYAPVMDPPVPPVKQRNWARTPIDLFILARLEAAGFAPAVDVEPAVLCRRLYFDLIGLPPEPDELARFEAEAARDRWGAVGALVDRLLASPRFGEHWGRHWLDVARFAESVTLRGFIFKAAWRYRDYVVGAFNADLPFDQFVREQVAGDLLPYATPDAGRRQQAAAMFLVLGDWNLEEQDKRQLDMDVVDEQLDTLGKAFLGQTIGCARCHDHKFDPIPTRDYYAMAGILKNGQTLKHANVSEWIERPLPLEPELERELREHEAAVERLKAEVAETRKSVQALVASGGGGTNSPVTARILAAADVPGVVVDSAQARKVGAWTLSQYSKHYIGDGYWHDDNSGKGAKTLSLAPDLKMAGRYEVRLAYVHAANRASNVPVTVFHADGETTRRIDQRQAPELDHRFVSLGQFRFEANGFGYVLVANEGTDGYVVADAVQFLAVEDGGRVSGETPQVATTGARGAVVVAGKGAARTETAGSSAAAVALQQARLKELEAQLSRLQRLGPRRPMAMGMVESAQPRDLAIHVRGSVHNLGATVPRGFLSVLTSAGGRVPTIGERSGGRLELADWLADARNPLTARVMANRIWQWLMGEGLVRTPDNFGTTGESPTHPELLDALAARLVAGGWSMKTLIREVAVSRCYGLAARPAGVVAGVPTAEWPDPENRLWGRGTRRRLTAEQLRDAILAAGGRLNLEMGGQTFPSDRAADYGYVDAGKRRSVYVPVFRNALPDVFEAFDFAPPSMVTGRRNRSTVPAQALFLLNHPWVREQAEWAARRVRETTSDPGGRVGLAYRLALGRWPTERERKLSLDAVTGAVGQLDEERAWVDLLCALFASADFRYLD